MAAIALPDVPGAASRLAASLLRAKEHIRDFVANQQHRIRQFTVAAQYFGTFMRTLFQFFIIIVLARMVVGFFSKPLEFIMLGMACIFLAVTYVIYYIFLIPPFSIIVFAIWFLLFDIIPLLLYVVVQAVLFALGSLIMGIMALINHTSKEGILNKMLMCHNSVAAWYKVPNYHLRNMKTRGVFCSRECFPGYYPSTTGSVCVRQPYYQPSYCPQAQVMRMYMDNKKDILYAFNDYNTTTNFKYLGKNPEQREKLMKKYYLEKLAFLNTCETNMKKYDAVPLTICSCLDILKTTHNMDDIMIARLKKVCNHAYCNSKTTLGFCAMSQVQKEEDQEIFWVKLIKIIIYIVVMIILIFMLFELLATSAGKSLLKKE